MRTCRPSAYARGERGSARPFATHPHPCARCPPCSNGISCCHAAQHHCIPHLPHPLRLLLMHPTTPSASRSPFAHARAYPTPKPNAVRTPWHAERARHAHALMRTCHSFAHASAMRAISQYMFFSASAFTSDLSSWDVSRVQDMNVRAPSPRAQRLARCPPCLHGVAPCMLPLITTSFQPSEECQTPHPP